MPHTHHEALRSHAQRAFGVLALTQKTIDCREILLDVLVALIGTPPPRGCVRGLEPFADPGLPLVLGVAVVGEELLQPSREVIRHLRVDPCACGHRRTGRNEAG